MHKSRKKKQKKKKKEHKCQLTCGQRVKVSTKMIQYRNDFSSFFLFTHKMREWRKVRFFCSGIMPLRYAEVTGDVVCRV